MDTRHQPTDRAWLNIVSAADYADASVHTVRRWLKRGLLPARKLATGTWRIRREDLEAFMQGERPSSGEFVKSAGSESAD